MSQSKAPFSVCTVFVCLFMMACMFLGTRDDQSTTYSKSVYFADSTQNWIYCTYDILPGTPVLIRSVARFHNRSSVKDTPCLRLHILYPNTKIDISSQS